MKVLYLSSASDWHVDLWTQYFTKDHQVFLFSDKEKYLDDQPFEYVKVHKSNGLLGRVLNFIGARSHKLFQANKLISARFYANRIDALVRAENIDIVHAHNLYYGYVASFLKTSVPIIFTPMGSDVIIHAQKNFIYRRMARRAFARAEVVTGDSLLLQKKGLQVGARVNNNHIIQNGVDSSLFFPRESSLKKELNITENQILIFSPRAITPLYNIDTIIDALSLLKAWDLDFKCMFSFAFGGEYHSKLKTKIQTLGLENHVIWLGYVKYEDMHRYYNACDLVLSVPSSDSSPKSVYEAMFCRKPIIISDLEWSHEILDDLECVCRVSTKNADELSESIKMVLSNPGYAEKIAKNSLQLAHAHFDYVKNMEKMEQIMQKVVSTI